MIETDSNTSSDSADHGGCDAPICSALPLCWKCGEKIEEEAVHIEETWWQCPDCHEIEFGSPPVSLILSWPNAEAEPLRNKDYE